MSEMETTPGPWKLEPVTPGFRAPGDRGAQDLMIVGANRICPGVVWDDSGLPEQKGNARLIVSAPILLSALKAMDEALTSFWGHPKFECTDMQMEVGPDVLAAWSQIRSAINSADAR